MGKEQKGNQMEIGRSFNRNQKPGGDELKSKSNRNRERTSAAVEIAMVIKAAIVSSDLKERLFVIGEEARRMEIATGEN